MRRSEFEEDVENAVFTQVMRKCKINMLRPTSSEVYLPLLLDVNKSRFSMPTNRKVSANKGGTSLISLESCGLK